LYRAVAVWALTVTTAAAQQRIDGLVRDEKTREAVAGANVVVAEGKKGTVTDAEGRFSLTVASLPATIRVTYLGYKEKSLSISSATPLPLTVEIREDVKALSEVVVVGYGTQRRKELTGAVSSVSQVSLAQQALTFDRALGGAVAGLNVTQSSGQPGATSTIRIRGSNSISGGNDPLYVVDGFILYSDNSSTRTGLGGTTSGVGGAGATTGAVDGGLNPLASINASDIESIEVLKDVSATAIYGSRGANGVIIITTKKGKRGRSRINYQGTVGVQSVARRLDLLDAEGWAGLYTELREDHKSPYDPSQSYDVSRLLPQGQTSDWQSAVLRSAATQTHQLSISGGGDDHRYLLSGNYSNQEGVIRNTGLTRYNGRLNLDKDVFRNFNVGANLTVGHTFQRGLTNLEGRESAGNAGPFDHALRALPLVPIYDANSNDGFNYYNPFEAGDFHIGDRSVNPLSDLLRSTVETRYLSFIGNVYAQYAILPQLTAKLNAGTNLNHVTQNFYAPSTSAIGLLVGGYGAVGNKDYNSSLVEFTLNYRDRLADIHLLEVLAGYTTQHTALEYATAGASGFTNEALTYHSLQSADTRDTPTSGGAIANLNSVLGRVNYSLLDRYNFTATLRVDGSSRFPAGQRWGYFPSLGFSWNIDSEPFFRTSTVSSLKLRASAGQVGNQEIGDYLYARLYTPRNYSFGDRIAVGYTATNYGNDRLRWETTTQYNAGIDFGLWNERLAMTFDAYYKKTTDLLVSVPVESTTGLRNKLENIGDISNKGIEFSFKARLVDSKDWQWEFLGNIARNVNRIEELGMEQFETHSNALLVKEGEPLGTFYGYVFDGVVQAGEESATPVPTWTGSVQPGDARFADRGGSPASIDPNDDRVILGSVQPDFTYGFATSVSYRRFDFSASFQGSYGNELYNALRHRLETPSLNFNGSAVLADRWTPTHTETDVPRAVAVPYVTLDSRYIEDASYLRLKDVTVGYTFQLPASVRLRWFASAQNLLTLTPYSGFDPEASRNGHDETDGLLQGIDLGAYPTSRTFITGLNLTF
jgi:TonB-linked SusC/RagA family outer membrane protein